MEAASVKNKQAQVSKHGLNLTALEEKILHMVEIIKADKSEIVSLKEKIKDLQVQIKALENSLVSETKDLEELSQEKMMTNAFVDNLLHRIDSLVKEK